MKQRCDKCGQALPAGNGAESGSAPSRGIWSSVLWASSFAVWTFVSLAATATIYEMYRVTGSGHVEVPRIAGMEFSEILTYAPLTPFFFVFAARYPLQRGNWLRRSLVHLAAGILFTVAHLAIKAFTPYGYWDPTVREWTSAIWDPHTHAFRMSWMIAIRMFWGNVVDDVSGAYIPIALIAHVVAYYSRFKERELRTTQFEAQLVKSHLQTLKSQLQPHFLFNTLNSISALMMTDVAAADRMMVSLGDLLRMSLDEDGSHMTTLVREVEFLSVYLEIERIRFEDKLRVRMDVAANCLDAQVPHLLLQPLVENAVKHGISKLSEAGEVEINARHDGDYLQIFIRDTGPGLAVPASAFTSNSGLGLRITKERLSTLYGSEQSFEIKNRGEGGVEVSVRIPFLAVPTPASVSIETADRAHMMTMRVEQL